MTRPLTGADRNRLRTPAGLWRALIPLTVLVGALVVFAWPHSGNNDGVHVVDTAGPIAAARQQSGFAVLEPVGLGPTWRPTATDFVAPQASTPSSLRISFVTPSGEYAEFFQSADSADAVSGLYGALTIDNPVQVNGTNWESFQTSRDRQLLRHTFGRVTAIVTGSASTSELVQLAGSLK